MQPVLCEVYTDRNGVRIIILWLQVDPWFYILLKLFKSAQSI